MGAGIVVWLLMLFVAAWFYKYIDAWLARKNNNKYFNFLHRVTSSFPRQRKKLYLAYCWTLINWAVKLLVFAWIFMAFYPMDFSIALVSVIFGDASSVLPIHGVAGLGTYEAGIAIGYSLFDKDVVSIMPAAVNLHLFILGVSALAVIPAQAIRKSVVK